MLGVMRAQPDKSRAVSPLAAILIGIAVFALDVFFVWRTIAGLMAGKILTLGRGAHTLVVEQQEPRMFWFQIVGHFLVEIMFAVGAVSLLIYGFRQLRR